MSRLSLVYNVLKNGPASSITAQGWVTSRRKLKDVVFIDINDGSSHKPLQVVIPKSLNPPTLSYGSSVEAEGEVELNSAGQLELRAEHVKLIGPCDLNSYPFSPKQKTAHDTSRQHLHFRPKLSNFKSLLRVRHKSLLAIHDWFDRNDFISVHTPILTANDCEGAGEIFKVLPISQDLIKSMKKKGQSDDDAFFGSPAFLSVSGQLHLEAICRGFTRSYAISPTFRAENSKSRLHLSEFYMVEAEKAFVSNLDEILNIMESLVKYLLSRVIDQCRPDIEEICRFDSVDPAQYVSGLERIVNEDFIRMSFETACSILKSENNTFQSFEFEKEGLSKEHELWLVQHLGNIPVFVTDWPVQMKPFYMKSSAENPNLVSAVDLLVPNVGELCGGSLREDDADVLERKLSEWGLTESMQWYLNLRRVGNVPSGGFGMGFERFLQLVTGLTNIKDTIPFPRYPHSLKL